MSIAPVRITIGYSFLALLLLSIGQVQAAPRQPPPNFESARRAIADAEAAGAADFAPVELGFAQERMQRAQERFDKRDQSDATRLAEQALADARLAQVKCRATKARTARERLTAENAALRRDALGEEQP